jgi:hypothetical protein
MINENNNHFQPARGLTENGILGSGETAKALQERQKAWLIRAASGRGGPPGARGQVLSGRRPSAALDPEGYQSPSRYASGDRV